MKRLRAHLGAEGEDQTHICDDAVRFRIKTAPSKGSQHQRDSARGRIINTHIKDQ